MNEGATTGGMVTLVSVIVPVYNSSSSVVELSERLGEVFASLSYDHELILIDDFSSDPETWPTLEELARSDSRVRALQLTRNFGQQAATLCGLREAQGDHVVTMDDDLQHRPEDIPALLEQAHRDIVIAQFSRKHHSLFKRATSRLKGVFDELVIGKPKKIQLTPFRLLSRTVVEGMLSISTPNPFIPALMLYVSRDIVGVEAKHDPRKTGRSGYNLVKMLGLFADLLVSNSSLMLRLVGQLGIVFSLVSFAMAVTVALKKIFYGTPVTGWTSLLTSVLLIGGLVLFSLGVVGEYLIRIIEASEAKPTYFVRRRTGESGGRPFTASRSSTASRFAVPDEESRSDQGDHPDERSLTD